MYFEQFVGIYLEEGKIYIGLMEDVQEFFTRYYRHPILFLTIPEIPPPPPAGGDPNDETIFPYQNY